MPERNADRHAEEAAAAQQETAAQQRGQQYKQAAALRILAKQFKALG